MSLHFILCLLFFNNSDLKVLLIVSGFTKHHFLLRARITNRGITEVIKRADPTLVARNERDRKSTRLNSSHSRASRMPSSA